MITITMLLARMIALATQGLMDYRSRNNEDAGTSAMATLSVTVVGHPHDGFVPCTTSVRRTGAKPGAVTSRLYVPVVPGTRQIVLQGMLVTTAPVTWTVTPSTDAPDVPPVTLMVMAIGRGQGSARQSWPQAADAIPKAPRATRTAEGSAGLKRWTAPHSRADRLSVLEAGEEERNAVTGPASRTERAVTRLVQSATCAPRLDPH